MANSELYCNDPGTTLSAAITSTSATSLTVTSGTGYPSSGNFRIKIDLELMLVTAVSGTTWTITRGIEGTTAATHLNSASVNAYFTAGGLDAIRTNISDFGTYANLPSTGKQGDRYRTTDNPYEYLFDGTNWNPFYPPYGRVYQPNPSNYSVIGTSGADSHLITTKGRIRFQQGGAGQGDSFWYPSTTNVPSSGDFRFRVLMRTARHSASGNCNLGIVLCDSASGKAVSWSIDNSANVNYNYWNNITSPSFDTNKFNTGSSSNIASTMNGADFWLALGYQSGSFFLAYSGNGIFWPASQAFSVTDWLPARPTRAGLYCADHASLTLGMEVLSMEMEQGTSLPNYWDEYAGQTITGL